MTSMGKQSSGNKLVKKHSATIHCSNTLSLFQRKISNALLFNAYNNLLTDEVHQISIRDLCGLISYKGRNHDAIKNAIRSLVTTSLEWNLVDDKLDEDWTASTILASAQLKGGVCSYSYSPHMKALLHMPKMYASINLGAQSKFRSSYGLALYETCLRYQNLKQTKWFDLSIIRRLLGVEDGHYAEFRDFKRRVLEKAVSEVNKNSHLDVEFETSKQGRAVSAVRFLISSNNESLPAEQIDDDVDARDPVLSQMISQFGLSRETAFHLLRDFSKEEIQKHIQMIMKSSSYKSGKIKNLAAYLVSAVKNNFQSPLSSSSQATENNRNDRSSSGEKEGKRLSVEEVAAENRFILGEIHNLDEGQKNNLLEAFYNTISKTTYALLYEREGIENVLVAEEFCRYVRRNRPEVLLDNDFTAILDKSS